MHHGERRGDVPRVSGTGGSAGRAWIIRPVRAGDFADWIPLWTGYNAFYGRVGPTALPVEITHRTWQRFLDPNEPVHAAVAEEGGALIALAHYLFHPSTTRMGSTCYLQDLFTSEAARGRGVASALIRAVCDHAASLGTTRVYWQTHETNARARALYDRVAIRSGFIVYVIDRPDGDREDGPLDASGALTPHAT